MTSVTGSVADSAPLPAATSTRTIASGPYATELSASRDRAASPSRLVSRFLSPSPGRSGTRGLRVPRARPNVMGTSRGSGSGAVPSV